MRSASRVLGLPLGERSGARVGIAALALLLATVLAYVPAIRGGFVWDDDDYVTENATLRSLAGLGRIWREPGAVPQYYPLTFTSLWLDYRLWGADPSGYHVVNVLLHAATALLFWRVLRRLALPGAWLAAAIFALHPVHVESVAWITERKNVLSGAFGVGALLVYLRHAGVGEPSRTEGSGAAAYALAIGLFACALLSKTVTCVLPVVVLVLLWWRRGRVGRADVLPLVPFFVLGAGLALVTVWMERHHVGAAGAAWELSPIARVLIAGRALWFYAAALAWPRDLTFVYPRWTIDTGAAWQYVFPLAAAGLVAALALARDRLGRGPLTAVLCFAVTLAPALGLVDVYPMRYTFVADHYQYLASMALIAAAVALAARALGLPLASRSAAAPALGIPTPAGSAAAPGRGARAPAGAVRGPRSSRTPVAAAALAAAILALLAALTWRQGRIYAGEETLWRDTLAKNPGAQMAHVNLGMLLHQAGRLDEAAAELGAALRLDPEDAEVHDNLGVTLAALGRRAEAAARFEEALRLAPASARTHGNLANLHAQEGRVDEAIAHYLEAVRLDPDFADAHGNLANVLASEGRIAEAIAHYREAIRRDPDFAVAHYNLGAVLAGAGDAEGARREYAAAVRLDPGYAKAERALGLLLAGQGRFTDALAHFEAVVRLRPGDAGAYHDLGAALAAGGRPEEALAAYARALELAPDYADAHNDLGVALAGLGRTAEAADHFRETLRLAPDHAEARDNLAALAARGEEGR